MALGERVTARLRAINISQAELARRVGIAQQTVNALINRNKVGSLHLHRIARELQTSTQYLTGETEDPAIDAAELAFTSQDREWLELLHALPPMDRAAVLQLARTIAHSAVSPRINEPVQAFLGSE